MRAKASYQGVLLGGKESSEPLEYLNNRVLGTPVLYGGKCLKAGPPVKREFRCYDTDRDSTKNCQDMISKMQ